jgi:hypothetical protein
MNPTFADILVFIKKSEIPSVRTEVNKESERETSAALQ